MTRLLALIEIECNMPRIAAAKASVDTQELNRLQARQAVLRALVMANG